jgi:hypothetical protein
MYAEYWMGRNTFIGKFSSKLFPRRRSQKRSSSSQVRIIPAVALDMNSSRPMDKNTLKGSKVADLVLLQQDSTDNNNEDINKSKSDVQENEGGHLINSKSKSPYFNVDLDANNPDLTPRTQELRRQMQEQIFEMVRKRLTDDLNYRPLMNVDTQTIAAENYNVPVGSNRNTQMPDGGVLAGLFDGKFGFGFLPALFTRSRGLTGHATSNQRSNHGYGGDNVNLGGIKRSSRSNSYHSNNNNNVRPFSVDNHVISTPRSGSNVVGGHILVGRINRSNSNSNNPHHNIGNTNSGSNSKCFHKSNSGNSNTNSNPSVPAIFSGAISRASKNNSASNSFSANFAIFTSIPNATQPNISNSGGNMSVFDSDGIVRSDPNLTINPDYDGSRQRPLSVKTSVTSSPRINYMNSVGITGTSNGVNNAVFNHGNANDFLNQPVSKVIREKPLFAYSKQAHTIHLLNSNGSTNTNVTNVSNISASTDFGTARLDDDTLSTQAISISASLSGSSKQITANRTLTDSSKGAARYMMAADDALSGDQEENSGAVSPHE